ncbi:unnamed protein product [Caenorhabditis nigoni]
MKNLEYGIWNKFSLIDVGRLVNFQNGGERGLVWVGAHRNPGCPTARSCAPIDAFSWTDGYTTGKTEFVWAPGEPSTWLKNGGTQNCAIMHTTAFDGQIINLVHGALNDSMCAFIWQMVACGKRPDFR